MRGKRHYAVIALAGLTLVSCSIASYNLGKNHFIQKHVSSIREELRHEFKETTFTIQNYLLQEITRQINHQCNRDDIISTLRDDVMNEVMKEVKLMESPQPTNDEMVQNNTLWMSDSMQTFSHPKKYTSVKSESTTTNMQSELPNSRSLKSDNVIRTKSIKMGSKHLQTMISRSLSVQPSTDLSSMCPDKSLFIFQIKLDQNDTSTSWLLQSNTFGKTFTLQPTSIQNNDFTDTYFTCLTPAIYRFQIFYAGNNPTSCGEELDCYRILLNNEVIVSGTSFSKVNTHLIGVVSSEQTRERLCDEQPLLSPMNHINNFKYDDRIEKIMSVLYSISKQEELNNFNTPQYKAACWILFDDDLGIAHEDELLFQRYLVAIFIFSLTAHPESVIPVEVCDVAGAVCNDKGHVFEILFGDRNLKGAIPSELSQLQFLEKIDLSNNELQGTIPTELGRLSRLREIKFSSSLLTGKIPTEFGRLVDLESLDLSGNNLNGNIPSEIGRCAKLKQLSFSENNLKGSIPPEIFHSTQLEWLDFEENHLTGTIPTEIQQAQNLQNLLLQKNELTGSIPSEIGTFSLATQIVLQDNKLTGTFPKEIAALENLTRIVLGNNKLTGTLPEQLGNIKSLDVLWLNNNSFTGTIPTQIYGMTLLQSLDLSSNKFSGSILDTFWDIPFKSVSLPNSVLLDDNELTGTVPDEFCAKDLFDFKVDSFPWYHKTKIDCSCCGGTPECYVWNPAISLVFGTIRPPCPKHNIHNFEDFSMYWIIDQTANTTYLENTNIHEPSDMNACLSPTGCYEIQYDEKNGTPFDEVIREDFQLSYSASSMSLNKQKQCDAISVCGTIIDPSHPKRALVNHLTQLAISDINLLSDPSSPSYQALCWIVTKDTFAEGDGYKICDGTLLQRYVMALFYFSHRDAFSFHTFSNEHTCKWPGVKCNSNNQYIEEISLTNRELQGSIITEIGLLQSLKSIDFSSNNLLDAPFQSFGHLLNLNSINLSNNKLHGILDPTMFTSLRFLRSFNVSNNQIGEEIPREIFEPLQIQNITLANNLFVGTLPKDIKCSQSLEHIDLTNNLLQGTISDAMFTCKKLKFIDVSQNGFSGFLPPTIGDLQSLIRADFHQNRLSGSIPVQLFKAAQLEILMLQSNQLTGKIPTQIANLENATVLSMNGNFLKGTIPSQLSNIKQIRMLHLHDNQLSGTAPQIDFHEISKDTFITDCGNPSVLSTGAIDCKSCTMCCNSEGACQEQLLFWIPIRPETAVVVLTVPFVVMILSFIILRIKQTNISNDLMSKRDPKTIYEDDSVYCFVLSKKKLAWLLYLITATIQIWLFATYLDASNLLNEDSDFQFNFRCPDNSLMCDDESTVGRDGWALFYIVVLLYLGRDLALGIVQIIYALESSDFQLLLSGVGILILTTLAVFTSSKYNFALAEKNTDLVTNAVILLFINDLDEHFLNLLMTLAPGWTNNVLEEIKENMKTKRDTQNQTRAIYDAPRRPESTTDVGLFEKHEAKTNDVSTDVQPTISTKITYTTVNSNIDNNFYLDQIEVSRKPQT